MSCEITKGRLEPCKDAIGGIDKVIFLNFKEYQITESLAGIIDDIKEEDGTTEPTGYEYIVRDQVSNLVENVNSSRDTGTTFIEQILTMQLKKRTAEDNVDIMLLIYGQPLAIVKDNNGKYWLAGQEWGLNVESGLSQTGAAFGDLNGYNLTMTGRERVFAKEVDPTVIAAMTIVQGT